MPAKLGGDTWDGFDTEFIGQLVKDLHKADPGSYGFRYNGETFGVEPKGINDEVVIDFKALRAQMKHVYNLGEWPHRSGLRRGTDCPSRDARSWTMVIGIGVIAALLHGTPRAQ